MTSITGRGAEQGRGILTLTLPSVLERCSAVSSAREKALNYEGKMALIIAGPCLVLSCRNGIDLMLIFPAKLFGYVSNRQTVSWTPVRPNMTSE